MKTINDIVSEVWPGWKLDSIIGAGTYGEVYRASREDAAGKNTAAIKVIKIYPRGNRTAYSDEAEAQAFFDQINERFSREVQVMQSLKGQSNLVSIDDYQIREDPEGNVLYYLIRMELLTPLLVDLDIRNYDEETLIRMGIDLCRGLEVCGSRHIVHRDIKPENIFVSPLGGYKLGDFGVARTLEMTKESLTSWEFAQWDRFTPPEVKSGSLSEADFEEAHRADIYSLGMVMYWIANDRCFPFMKKSHLHSSQERNEAEARRMSGEALPPPDNISSALADVILKACAFRNEDRYENAEQFRLALEEVLRPGTRPEKAPEKTVSADSPSRSRRWVILTAIMLVAALIAGGWLLFRKSSSGFREKEANRPSASAGTASEDETVDTLVFHEAEYPHVYHIGQEMSLGGWIISDEDLTDITIRLYTEEEVLTQQITPAPGAKRFDMREAGDELFRKLGEGQFWFEIIASDAAGRTVGFSHRSTSSLTAEDHTIYWIDRSARAPELRGTTTWNGHTYEIYYLAGGGWDTSNTFAQGRGGHLVSFADKEEFSAVTVFAQGMGCKWLNAGAQYRDNTWSWTDGTPFDFHPWYPNAPEDNDIPYDPYGSIIYSKEQWYLSKATQYEMTFFIVEYDMELTPKSKEMPQEEPGISGETYPTALSNGQSFGLRGTIICQYPMTEIRGTILNLVTGEKLFDVYVPLAGTTSYTIGIASGETINDHLDFSSDRCCNSYLNYQLTVQYEKDGETLSKVVLNRDFTVGSPLYDPPDGFGQNDF